MAKVEVKCPFCEQITLVKKHGLDCRPSLQREIRGNGGGIGILWGCASGATTGDGVSVSSCWGRGEPAPG